MADLTVIEKYPNSYRLDHPDFSDVRKTTYAKGVITEFQKLQDDPILVAPMVKVEVAGQESDFIPLFYHPKKQYWDDSQHKATDFNQEEKYFEKAWMSFRGDDEVVVMLREGKPYAVIGFVDSKPSIGEDIILVEFPARQDNTCPPIYKNHFFYLQCSIKDLYQWDQPDGLDLDVHRNGPDGLELGLTEGQLFSKNGDLYYEPPKPWAPHITGGNQDYCQVALEIVGPPYYANRIVNQNAKYYNEFFVIVGPFLYIFQVLWSRNYYYVGLNTALTNAEVTGHYTKEYYDDPPGFAYVYVMDTMYDAGPAPNYPLCSNTIDRMVVRAAIYSKNLWDTIKSQPSITTKQADQLYIVNPYGSMGTEYQDAFLQNSFPIGGICNAICGYGLTPEWDKANFKVRPHNPI